MYLMKAIKKDGVFMIGIIIAMDEELNALKKYLKINKENKIYDLIFLEGEIKNKKCVVVKCGIGKVNAARTTQILIDNYKADYIINIGVAGGLKNTNVGDIIIASKLVQYDFDITKFDHELGFITGVGKYLDCDKNLIDKAINLKSYNTCLGVIATGDTFITSIEQSRFIEKEFDALAVEMEGAAIAQICYLSNIPFIIIRSISDNPNNDNQLDFSKFIDDSSLKVAKFVNEMI